MADDELAKLYFVWGRKSYRVKVFPETVWLERQPFGEQLGGDNVPFNRKAYLVWEPIANRWFLQELIELVNIYEAATGEGP